MNQINDELKGWDEIITDSESGVPTKTESSKVRSNKKLVLAIANLGLNIFSLQKVVGSRLDNLEKSIDRFNNESSKLYKIYLLLTFINVLAVTVNVLIVIFKK